jgi:glutaconate CoA-transferase subunit A
MSEGSAAGRSPRTADTQDASAWSGVGGLGRPDKRTTLEAAVAQVRDGMTVGLGGWGSRRKPMAVVRALARQGVKDLTVVSFGGPDVGLLAAVGALRRVVAGFVTLDSIPLDPHWRRAREHGAVELVELDEGMCYLGLLAAAWRVPFLPTRVGLGSSVLEHQRWLRTIRSPYPVDSESFGAWVERAGAHELASAKELAGAKEMVGAQQDPGCQGRAGGTEQDAGTEVLVAMPAIHLDVAFVHVNVADSHGNAAVLGPDPFFDDLMLQAARRGVVLAERVVEPGGLAELGLERVVISRLFVDEVVETPGGAHFTACLPDYERDEALQRRYVEAASDPELLASFLAEFVHVDEERYQRSVRSAVL